MRNKMNRCCCDVVPETSVLASTNLACVYTNMDYEGGDSFTVEFVTGGGFTIGSRIVSDPDYTPLGYGHYGGGFLFNAGEIPAGVSAATLQFWGISGRFEPDDAPPSGYGAPDQSVRIYAFEWPGGTSATMPDHTIQAGTVWQLTRAEDWEDGTLVTSPDIAATINAITGGASWNPATSRLAVCIYVLSQDPAGRSSLFEPNGSRGFEVVPPDTPTLIYST